MAMTEQQKHKSIASIWLRLDLCVLTLIQSVAD